MTRCTLTRCTTTTRHSVAVALLAAAVALGGSAAPPDPAAESRPYYHLRLVRITGAAANPGAGVGCETECGRPIVLPGAEPWGNDDQLQALARALGGERADAVSGSIVVPDDTGAARYAPTVYAGPSAVRLLFEAQVPATPGAPHRISALILPLAGDEPLAEARVSVTADLTLAIAAPSPVPGEWIVLAVTPLEPAEAIRRLGADGEPLEVTGDVEPPRLLERAEPEYPETARSARQEGKIVLRAVIDTEGRVRAVSVLRVSEGGEDLAAAAVRAASRWRYEPARRNGTPVPVNFYLVMSFKLE